MFEDLEPGQAVEVDWTAERYHADLDTTSRSQLDDLRTHGPATFYAKHVARTAPAFEGSGALALGTNVHIAVLEPHEWCRRLAPPAPVRPAIADGRRKSGSPERNAYDDHVAALAHYSSKLSHDSIKPEEANANLVELIAGSVHRHEYAASLLYHPSTKREQTVVWRTDDGLLVRVRADLLVDLGDLVIVGDLKTTSDPSPDAFGTSVARFGYHRQGAIYSDAVAALRPGVPVAFVIIAVRSRGPFEVACYQLGEAELDKGRAEYRETMAELDKHRTSNDWTAEWQQSIHNLTMPGWAYYETK